MILKKFEKMNSAEIQEFVTTIKEQFDVDNDRTMARIIADIKALIDKNIIMAPIDVIFFDIMGMFPVVMYYHIAKMFCKGNRKKLELLNTYWPEDTIERLSTT